MYITKSFIRDGERQNNGKGVPKRANRERSKSNISKLKQNKPELNLHQLYSHK